MTHTKTPFVHRRSRLLPLLAAAFVCLGATSQSCKIGRDLKDRNDTSDFVVELQLQNDAGESQTTFDQEDRITFVLNVTNDSEDEKTLEFPSTLQADFAILTDDRQERVLWVASQTINPQNVVTEVEFAPGQTRTFKFDAVILDVEGEFLPRDDYQAVGALVLDFPNFATDPLADHDLASNPLPFTLD